MTRRESLDEAVRALEYIRTRIYLVEFPSEVELHTHAANGHIRKAISEFKQALLVEDLIK